LTDEEAAAIADVQASTLSEWRRIPEFAEALKKATAVRLLLIESRVDNWQSISWLVERQYYSRFAKPEVQISLNNSFNQTVDALSVSISAEELREIEAEAAPSRETVRQMFAAYRRRHSAATATARGSAP
jgi:hypothetical protein